MRSNRRLRSGLNVKRGKYVYKDGVHASKGRHSSKRRGSEWRRTGVERTERRHFVCAKFRFVVWVGCRYLYNCIEGLLDDCRDSATGATTRSWIRWTPFWSSINRASQSQFECFSRRVSSVSSVVPVGGTEVHNCRFPRALQTGGVTLPRCLSVQLRFSVANWRSYALALPSGAGTLRGYQPALVRVSVADWCSYTSELPIVAVTLECYQPAARQASLKATLKELALQ